MKAVAVALSMARPGGEVEPDPCEDQQARVRLVAFRRELHGCFTRRADALPELTDAILCAGGPVRSPAELPVEPEFRRGHGSVHDARAGGRDGAPKRRPARGARPRAPRRGEPEFRRGHGWVSAAGGGGRAGTARLRRLQVAAMPAPAAGEP